MFVLFVLLTFYLGWRLTGSLRAMMRDGLHSRSAVGNATGLCFVPMAWCFGYTACVTVAWIALQLCALVSDVRPDVNVCAWASLGALLVGTFRVRGADRTERASMIGRPSPAGVLLLVAIWILALGLTFGVTRIDSGILSAPQNLIRDLYSHTALIRSFSAGYNFPTEYPFFYGEPIRYHFLFYFGGGVLEATGAPLSVALNLPSALALGSLLSLIAFVAWRLTGSLSAASVAIVLCLFRSSLSWVDWIQAVWGAFAENNSTLRESFFYGTTPYEDWGIFSLNVHLNQRHLLHGFTWMLIVLIGCLFTPQLGSPVRNRRSISHAVLGVLLGCGAYWNGAAFMASMLALLPLVCLSEYRAKALIVGLSAVLSSWVVVMLVTHGSLSATPFEPVVRIGFLSPSSAPLDVARYAVWIFGVLPVVSLVAGWRSGARGVIAWWCGLMPIAFIFTVQITRVAPHGHKFITAGVIIWSILSAGLIVSLLASSRLGSRLIGQILVVAMTLTGVLDACTLLKLGETRLYYPVEDRTIAWIRDSTSPQSLFLVASRGDQAPLLAGRRIFIGPKSLSSEAGHSYDERERWLREVALQEPAAQLVALRQKGVTHISTETCRDVKGLISDPCPAIPEVSALIANPLLQKLYASADVEVLGVPPE